jgi:hypothetical protein
MARKACTGCLKRVCCSDTDRIAEGRAALTRESAPLQGGRRAGDAPFGETAMEHELGDARSRAWNSGFKVFGFF